MKNKFRLAALLLVFVMLASFCALTAFADEDDAGDRINELNFDLKEKYFNKKFGI